MKIVSFIYLVPTNWIKNSFWNISNFRLVSSLGSYPLERKRTILKVVFLLIEAKICALMENIQYDLCIIMHHKRLNSSNLTQIDAKALSMSLTCILEIYLRFNGRKKCKSNRFRFLKIQKGLNEEMSESRLMDYQERQEEDVTSLGDEE